jgi:hypothetical protein
MGLKSKHARSISFFGSLSPRNMSISSSWAMPQPSAPAVFGLLRIDVQYLHPFTLPGHRSEPALETLVERRRRVAHEVAVQLPQRLRDFRTLHVKLERIRQEPANPPGGWGW